ncbi:MAG: metallophosphoesterase [Acidobacteria bacterium]|nr:metallophosphoesterase [Acidobacteriota bacterium]MCA1651862.1 metallophosphoesterase [Acidobacteriota bacterium]
MRFYPPAVRKRLILPSVAWTCVLALALSAYASVGAASRAPAASPSRVIAIGDIHGDADAFRAILKTAGLIDDQGAWIGGDATLVQTGDFTDRGANVREVMDLLMDLESRARAAGGRVVPLMGNHESMNVLGETRDVTPAIYATFADSKSEERREAAYTARVKLNAARVVALRSQPDVYAPPARETWMAAHPLGWIEYREAFEPHGTYGKWLRAKDVVTQIGDTIFLHGGLQPDMAPGKLDQLNERIRKEIGTYDRARKMMADRKLILPSFTLQETLEAARAELAAVVAQGPQAEDMAGGTLLTRPELLDLDALMKMGAWYVINPNGPLWFRGYATWPSEEGTPQMKKILSRYRAAHVVVGHTPMGSARITPRFSSQVFLIDTGMLSSHYPGGRASALEIRDGRYTALYQDGKTVLLEPGSQQNGK